MDKLSLVASVLLKYGKTEIINLKAWDHFYRQAQDDKAWARGLTPDWFESACIMSVEMAERYARLPTAIIAAQHYSYSLYRSKARASNRIIDPIAFELWESFVSEGDK